MKVVKKEAKWVKVNFRGTEVDLLRRDLSKAMKTERLAAKVLGKKPGEPVPNKPEGYSFDDEAIIEAYGKRS